MSERGIQWVDPWIGTEPTALPEPTGMAASWFWPKAQIGNTHPGACYPFGMLSACAYSGAYPTGYGKWGKSTEGPPPAMHSRPVASGFTHFQQTGTGDMRIFYNHLKVTPSIESLETYLTDTDAMFPLDQENSTPGHYSCRLSDSNIKAELTVSNKAAVHRYTFPGNTSPLLAFDFSCDGINIPERHVEPSEAHIEVLSPNTATGMIVLKGIPLYVYLELNRKAAASGLWMDQEVLEAQELAFEQAEPLQPKKLGCYFKLNASASPLSVEVKVGFSFRNVNRAMQHCRAIHSKSFDDVRSETRAVWDEHLNRIQIRGGTPENKTLFYTSLYHSLIKPCNMEGESPYWPESGPFFTDISTLWDTYKTQVPLMLSVYPETGSQFINSLLEIAERDHTFPIGYVIDKDPHKFAKQATCLAHYSIIDAFYRRLSGIDWKQALNLMQLDLQNGRGATFKTKGAVFPFTHTLDLAGACFATAQLAQYHGKIDTYRELMKLAGNWRNVYNRKTGTLKASDYYEGGAWNYSFRLLHDMAGRITLCGTNARFIEILDKFFGREAKPCQQLSYPTDHELEKKGYALRRFSGLNNEHDMETPYAYHYAGRPDRTWDTVHSCLDTMFKATPGGFCGNEDSGAISSWYVWSALGLFPVSGQEILLIGSPLFEEVEIQLRQANFRITVKNFSKDNIHVGEATLNGDEIDRAYISVDEFETGGELILEMTDTPTLFGTSNRPPSWKL
jgi:putative alpha-1,2-mannosidase